MPVSNSSPLIHLSRLGKLGYMKQAFPSLMIPPAVRLETIEKGRSGGYKDVESLQSLENDGWLRTTKLSHRSMRLSASLSDTVGEGEAQAIALALERNERLFIDDLKGRRAAEFYRIETTTTIGLIFELLVRKVLSRVDYQRNIMNYGAQGWISEKIISEFIQKGTDYE